MCVLEIEREEGIQKEKIKMVKNLHEICYLRCCIIDLTFDRDVIMLWVMARFWRFNI